MWRQLMVRPLWKGAVFLRFYQLFGLYPTFKFLHECRKDAVISVLKLLICEDQIVRNSFRNFVIWLKGPCLNFFHSVQTLKEHVWGSGHTAMNMTIILTFFFFLLNITWSRNHVFSGGTDVTVGYACREHYRDTNNSAAMATIKCKRLQWRTKKRQTSPFAWSQTQQGAAALVCRFLKKSDFQTRSFSAAL